MASIELGDLKALLAENCMLQTPVEEIDEDTPLFGPGSVGLDSIDALQLAVGVEQKFGVPLKDPEVARQVLRSLGALREWLTRQQEAA
jgi:acyl carrier protein